MGRIENNLGVLRPLFLTDAGVSNGYAAAVTDESVTVSDLRVNGNGEVNKYQNNSKYSVTLRARLNQPGEMPSETNTGDVEIINAAIRKGASSGEVPVDSLPKTFLDTVERLNVREAVAEEVLEPTASTSDMTTTLTILFCSEGNAANGYTNTVENGEVRVNDVRLDESGNLLTAGSEEWAYEVDFYAGLVNPSEPPAPNNVYRIQLDDENARYNPGVVQLGPMEEPADRLNNVYEILGELNDRGIAGRELQDKPIVADSNSPLAQLLAGNLASPSGSSSPKISDDELLTAENIREVFPEWDEYASRNENESIDQYADGEMTVGEFRKMMGL